MLRIRSAREGMSGMDKHRWDDDEVLFSDLAEAWREVSSLSARIAEQAEGALAWRTVDADLLLATLSFDSSLQSSGSSRDGEDGHRVLVFHATPLAVELELQFDRVVGQIVPPGAGEITLESADGDSVRVEADDLGFFMLPRMPAGSVRLHCETPTSRLVTDWFQS
jgi:hypothetical protein